jgi:hypothetical protein
MPHSMQPRSELQALLAVQIIATGFAGLRFLRQSHRNMTEDFINVGPASPAIPMRSLPDEFFAGPSRTRLEFWSL